MKKKRRHVKRYSPPGTSPGTLPPPAPSAAGPARLRLASYGPGFLQETSVSRPREVVPAIPAGRKGWLRVVGHEQSMLAELGGCLGVHPLVLEDVVNLGQRPKLENHESYLFMVIDLVVPGGNGLLEERQVSLLLFSDLVVSIEEDESDLFRLVEGRLRSEAGKMRSQGVDYLAYALLDAAVDHFFPVLEQTGDEIDELEERLLAQPDKGAFERLYSVKRNLLRMRKIAWPLREMVGALTRTESALLREGTSIWLRDVYDHTVQIMEIIESFREMTASLVDLYLSIVSNRMNEVMKVLTIIATIFIPLTFIAGVYGMNFNPEAGPLNMPELTWRLGYPAALAVMAIVALGMLWMFKRRKWI
jgi:magnesium transporter